MVKDSYRIIYFISLFLTWWWVHFILYECLNQLWTPVGHQHQPLTRTRVSIAVSSNRHPELYRSNRCASARGRVYLYMFIVMYGRRGIFPVEAYSGRSRERSSYSSYSSFTVSHPLCSTQREIWRTVFVEHPLNYADRWIFLFYAFWIYFPLFSLSHSHSFWMALGRMTAKNEYQLTL